MAIYPLRATMWHDEAIVTVGGGSIFSAHDQDQDHAKYSRVTTHANSDAFTQSFVLAAGIYNFTVVGYQDTNIGKIDWYVDDVLIASGQDWYGVSTHNIIKTVLSVSVTGSGRHVLKGITNGKNASSSDYYIQLTKYWFSPSADTVDAE